MSYLPNRGDLVWLTFDPQSGREQAGRRPAIILSPLSYNRPAGLALFCPITHRVKGYPFEVPLPEGCTLKGAVLADQVRSMDWRTRRAEFVAQAPVQLLQQVLGMAAVLLSHK